MKKLFIFTIVGLTLLFAIAYATVYFASYSTGTRSGELIKFSDKGIVFKTWEGEISKGISGAQIFSFSVENKEIIEKLQKFQGSYVKVTYKERFLKLMWLGDTKYFITDVVEEESPHFRNR